MWFELVCFDVVDVVVAYVVVGFAAVVVALLF